MKKHDLVVEKSDLDLYTMGMNNKEIKIGDIFLARRPYASRCLWPISLHGATSLLITADNLEEAELHVYENYNELIDKIKASDKSMSGMGSYVEQFGTALE